jgi:hypothetical protein
MYSLSLWEIEAIFLSYGGVLVMTTCERPSRLLWGPIFAVTPQRVKFARCMIGLVIAKIV